MPTSKQVVDRRGRKARHPREIPTKGWRDIAYRIKDSLDDDNISIVAAGVAFYALLAIFPALVAMVSIYGIIADPADVQRQFDALSGILPTEAQVLLSEQLRRITSQASTALSVGVGVGVILALWSATRGTKAFMIALNIVYGEKEKRGFLKLNAIALMLTLGAIVLAILALGMIVVLPILLSYLDLPEIFQVLVSLLPWLLLAFTFILGLAVLYRYGPSRSEAQWRWVSWGAVAATVLWIAGSALFSFYVANFAQYNKTYGSVGALIILLMWFFVTAYIILFAAEFNAEMEHQTKTDTTRGKPQPMGERGAYVADTVGKPYGDETGAP